jgi:hypothetical protein
MLIIMRRRRVILSAILLAPIVGIALLGILPKRPALAWRVVKVWPGGPAWVLDGMESNCWRVDIEVTNLTSSEIIVDWNRDETAFKVAGRWENLSIGALMPHLDPTESQSFSIVIPRRAQACRLQMYYERGPLWYETDGFLRDHGIFVPDAIIIPCMKLNKKLPGHFKRLNIEVEMPTTTSEVDQANTHNHWIQATL